jgi:hypothetical protein
VRAISVTLSKMPLAARENKPWTVVSGNERGLEGGKVAGDGSQPEPYVRGLSLIPEPYRCELTPFLLRPRTTMLNTASQLQSVIERRMQLTTT